MPKITFLPSGVTIDVSPGTTVFHAAGRAEVPIASQCGGKCACALCRVKIVSGELISPMRWEEEGHMGNAFFITKQRLSCQLQVFGDVTIEVTEPEAREAPRTRYIPHALIKKRERMEREADVATATSRPRPDPPPRSDAPRPKRRRKPRNPGAPRSGDSRAPEGAKKKKKE